MSSRSICLKQCFRLQRCAWLRASCGLSLWVHVLHCSCQIYCDFVNETINMNFIDFINRLGSTVLVSTDRDWILLCFCYIVQENSFTFHTRNLRHVRRNNGFLIKMFGRCDCSLERRRTANEDAFPRRLSQDAETASWSPLVAKRSNYCDKLTPTFPYSSKKTTYC